MKPADGSMERAVFGPSLFLTDFNEFYWLKEELVGFCREVSLRIGGGKIALADDIRAFLATSSVPPSSGNSRKTESGFDWNEELLHHSTVITDSYRNPEHVRSFFKEKTGP